MHLSLETLYSSLARRSSSHEMAAFTLTFIDQKVRLVFSVGLLGEEELGSAMDQIAHLTGIVAQMMRPETRVEALERVETSYDRKMDRWQNFRGVGLTDKKDYFFDESHFGWKPL